MVGGVSEPERRSQDALAGPGRQRRGPGSRVPGSGAAVVVPIGFVCDHIEVLYDLDMEARQTAEAAGLAFYRSGTVADHPAFIRMLGDLVLAGAVA